HFIYHSLPTSPHLHSFPTRRSSDLSSFLKSLPKPGPATRLSTRNTQHATRNASPLPQLSRVSGVTQYPASKRIIPISFSLRKPTGRKSTRLNSSHQIISYAVFCLKK